jgi:hypothetical protein
MLSDPRNAQSRRTDAGVGDAISCKNIGRKLATMTPMGVMSLPEGVAEEFLNCIQWQPFLTRSNSGQQPLFRRGQVLFQWRHIWRRDAPRRPGNAQSRQQIEVAGQRG